jgi:hypothetical protein
MSQQKEEQTSGGAEFHRKTAVACFNKTWDFLDQKARSREEDLQMLHAAHTSRYHWGYIGNPHNFAIGDWQISRVYAALNEPSLALNFAKSALELMEKNGLSDILCTGYEAMARAHAVAKNFGASKDYLKRAREQLAKTNIDDEAQKIYSQQIDETEALIRN